jgi:chemotaxis protein MotA
MDLLTLLGMLLAVVAVVAGAILKGAGAAALVSLAALLIVLLGTTASICVRSPCCRGSSGRPVSRWTP